NNSWIYIPRQIFIYTSLNGTDFELTAIQPVVPDTTQVVMQKVEWEAKDARYIRVRIEPFGIIPAGFPGEGNQAWLFCDELFVE
ncbi:MAG: beta-N-acetylhexosaminidase, partial [Saprospiraceae bacterium]